MSHIDDLIEFHRQFIKAGFHASEGRRFALALMKEEQDKKDKLKQTPTKEKQR